jgi:hypothetical protein
VEKRIRWHASDDTCGRVRGTSEVVVESVADTRFLKAVARSAVTSLKVGKSTSLINAGERREVERTNAVLDAVESVVGKCGCLGVGAGGETRLILLIERDGAKVLCGLAEDDVVLSHTTR